VLSFLEKLDLSGNSLTGSFVHVVASSLLELDLSNNQLTGSLPDMLAVSGIGLQVLRLSNNSGITGTLSVTSEWHRQQQHGTCCLL
jgi:Leucine-rich repeat (LRR) protein